MDYKYIIINEIVGMGSNERANVVNENLWVLTKSTGSDVTNGFFGTKRLIDNRVAILCDMDLEITINGRGSVTRLLNVFPDLDPTERSALVKHIENNDTIVFRDIVPSGTSTYTSGQLVDMGLLIDEY